MTAQNIYIEGYGNEEIAVFKDQEKVAVGHFGNQGADPYGIGRWKVQSPYYDKAHAVGESINQTQAVLAFLVAAGHILIGSDQVIIGAL